MSGLLVEWKKANELQPVMEYNKVAFIYSSTLLKYKIEVLILYLRSWTAERI